MARVGRLAGALLAETCDHYYLVGNTKEPCDWWESGFEAPSVDPSEARFVRLTPRRAVILSAPQLTMQIEGEPLAVVLGRAKRLG
jgi:hypothetical protein